VFVFICIVCFNLYCGGFKLFCNVCVCVCVCVWVGFVMCGCLDNVHSLNLFGCPDRFFRAFSSVVRQMPGYNSQRIGHGQHSSKFVICVVLFVIHVVLLLIVMFYVLFMCKYVLPPGVNPTAVDKYININTTMRHLNDPRLLLNIFNTVHI
jgi:hypothetical protein